MAAREGGGGRRRLAAVLDPSGLLVDTWPATARALALACRACALPAPDLALCPSWLSAPADALVPALVSAPAEVQATVLKLFRRHWPAAIEQGARPRPGVVDGLARLASAEVGLWVATHVDDPCLTALLASTALAGDVQARAAFSAGNPALEAKPSPAMLASLAARHPAVGRRVVVVADTPCDLEMARRAGVPAVAATFGRSSEATLAGWSPLQWAHAPHQLADAVVAAARQRPPQPPSAA